MEVFEVCLKKKNGVHLIIDYFSAIFPFICYEEDSKYGIINETILMCCDFFNIDRSEVEACDFNVNRFHYLYHLAVFVHTI